MTTLEHLQEYLRRDWYVFPLQKRGKQPLTKNGWKDATLDMEQIQRWRHRWPGCNFGIATGPSELLVVDLDGAAAEQEWISLTVGRHTQTLTALTGGGGWHVVYSDPERRGRNSTRLLGRGIDTRGQGGYIVAPPSIHPSGRRYEWFAESMPPAARCPEWILELLRREPPEPRQAPRMAVSGDSTTPLGGRVMEGILRRLAAAQDGNRHDLNYWAGVRAAQLHVAGHVPAHALGTILDAALAMRKDHTATRRDTLDGWRWGLENPGSYPPAEIAAAAPRARAPRLYAPRQEMAS